MRIRMFLFLAVALVLPATIKAQGTAPSPSPTGGIGGGQSFGGGIGGLSGNSFGLSGGTSGLSGGTSGLSGGMSGFTGSTQGNGSFRGGFFGQINATGYGGGTAGYGGGIGGGITGSSTTPGAANAFGRYYINPQAPGAPNASNTNSFWTPIYGGTTGQYNPSTPNYPQNQNQYQSGTGTRRPAYVVGLGSGFRPPGPAVTQTEVEQVLARSTGLSPNRDIRVAMDGPTVILRGTVATDYDRRLAEAMIRLSPGVYAVRNELEVKPPAPGPAP
jgi:BON domain